MELATRAKELLTVSEYINIATVTTECEPWNTPATGVYDKQFNFYWSSWKAAQHSINLRANAKVFLTLYDSTRQRGDNHQKCLYIQAQAIELEEVHDIMLAMNLLYGAASDNEPSDFLEDAQRRMYKATPTQLWLNDVSEKEVTSETTKMRVEVSLKSLRSLL